MKTKADLIAELTAIQVKDALARDHETKKGYGDRITRAGAIVLAGGVTPLGNGEYEVRSQSQPDKVYICNGSCKCEDAVKGERKLKHGAPGGFCKHRMAAVIDRRNREHLKGLVDKLIPHTTHRWNCTEHRDLEITCWQQACGDPADVPCPTCERAAEAKAAAETSLASEADGWTAFVGETVDHDGVPASPACPESTYEEAKLEADTEDALEAYVTEAEHIANTEKPIDLNRFQYEESPMPTIIQPPLPEAPVSVCLRFKTPGGGEITYTLRGHDDGEVLARIPVVLAGLEQQLDTGTHKQGWFSRVYNALLSPEAKKEREEQPYVPRAEYARRTGQAVSGK